MLSLGRRSATMGGGCAEIVGSACERRTWLRGRGAWLVYVVLRRVLGLFALCPRSRRSNALGPAKNALLRQPSDLALDAEGNLYMSDFWHLLEVAHTPLAAAGPRLQLGGSSTQHLLARHGITVNAGCDRPSSPTAAGSA